MFSVIVILFLSLCIVILLNYTLKLQQELNRYKLERYMQKLNYELDSTQKVESTNLERILQ